LREGGSNSRLQLQIADVANTDFADSEFDVICSFETMTLPTHFTYATDVPLDSGQATTVFLRKIQPLKFPNLTTTDITNLFVKTKSSDGKT